MTDNNSEYPTFAPGGSAAPSFVPTFAASSASTEVKQPEVQPDGQPDLQAETQPKVESETKPKGFGGWVKAHKPIVIVIIVVIVLAIAGGVTTAVVLNNQKTVIDIPLPTATIDAVAFKDDATPFLKAMPPKVLEFALQSYAVDESLDDSLPLESYSLVYSDKATDDPAQANVINLTIAQFSTDNLASDVYKKITKANPGTGTIEEGEIKVDSKFAGNFIIVNYAERSDSTTDAGTYSKPGAIAYWDNGNSIFIAKGPASRIVDFYKAYSF